MKIQFLMPVFLLCSFFSSAVFAIGLGEIELKSRLNQRFEAQIPVIVNEETDVDDLTVQLATTEHFEREGLKKTASVLDLHFKPVR